MTRSNYLLLAFLSVVLILPLLLHIYIGLQTRLIADDFCSAQLARSVGVIDAAVHWYLNWSGRFSAHLFDALVGISTPRVVQFQPAAGVVVWFSGLMGLFVLARIPAKLAFVLVSLLLSALFSVTPSVAQSLYWGQGMRSVLTPLILLTLYGVLVLYQKQNRASIMFPLLGMLVAFIAGGFSETYVALQTTLLCMAVIFTLYLRKSEYLPLLLAGLLGSFCSLLLVVLSPGNAIRQAHFAPTPDFVELLAITSHSLFGFVKKTMKPTWDILDITNRLLTLSGVILLPGLAEFTLGLKSAFQIPRKTAARFLLWFPFATLVLLFSCFVPAAYGMSMTMPARTEIIPLFVLLTCLLVWGYFGWHTVEIPNRLRKPAPVAGVLILLFSLNWIWIAARTMETLPAFKSYADAWEHRDKLIQQAVQSGSKNVVVPYLTNPYGLGDIATDSNWVSSCASNYYRIRVSSGTDK